MILNSPPELAAAICWAGVSFGYVVRVCVCVCVSLCVFRVQETLTHHKTSSLPLGPLGPTTSASVSMVPSAFDLQPPPATLLTRLLKLHLTDCKVGESVL